MASNLIVPFTQTSCVLSMIGSCLMGLGWAYPEDNREKHARILLLWLSVSDFLSSFIYFVQTFYPDLNGVGMACQTFAVLGIIFPVASFVWTNIIAFYLYSVIVNRFAFRKEDFKKCFLKTSHILSWGLGLLCGLLILGFGHAGRNNNNTGGWCWIYSKHPNDSASTFGWEIIGGKLVEWVSCFILLPFFYASAACELTKFDNASYNLKYESSFIRSKSPTSFTTPSSDISSGIDRSDSSTTTSSEMANKRLSLSRNVSEDVSLQSPLHHNSVSTPIQKQNIIPATPSTTYTSSSNNRSNIVIRDGGGGHSSSDSDEPTYRQRNLSSDSVSMRKPVRFNKFYMKMAVLPLVFFFIRFWSSCRIFINLFSNPSEQTNNAFGILQAIFDPSQGFFNALIFVVGSDDGFRHTLVSLSHFVQSWLFWCPCSNSVATYLSNKALKISEQMLSANGINSINNPTTSSESTTTQYLSTRGDRTTGGRSAFDSSASSENDDYLSDKERASERRSMAERGTYDDDIEWHS